MCGIVGYSGHKNAKDIILNGLFRMEYRGYDSAGMTLFNAETEQFELYKDKGRVANLSSLVSHVTGANSGIGHTRWATHGKVNRENAHPHVSSSNRFTLVHNGVIENYQTLRDTYLNGKSMMSETDTEIIVQLIERFSRDLSVEEAILKTLKLLEGSYALLIVDDENPKRMYAAKHKSPLLIGEGESEYIVASDLMAMTGVAKTFLPLKDFTFAVIDQSRFELYNLDYQKKAYDFEVLDFDDTLVTKGDFEHYMLKEIMEEPGIIRHIIAKYYDEETIKIDPRIIQEIKDADRIYVLAAGTSMHAGYISKTLFETMSKKPLEVHIASEFAYHTPILTEKPFFIMISQSGETADLRACLTKLQGLGHKTLTVTNVKTSTLAREADFFLEIYAGPEIAVASTKAYVAQIAVLSILAQTLSENPFDLRFELSKLSQAMDHALSLIDKIQMLAKTYLTKHHCFYIGRGLDYHVALEAALKLKEISYIHTEGYAAGELKHGTIALIEEDTPVIALISNAKTALNTRSNLDEVKSRGAQGITIVLDALKTRNDDIVLNDVHPLLAPMLMVIPTQLFAYFAALERGLDIDKPRNLAKSVTVE